MRTITIKDAMRTLLMDAYEIVSQDMAPGIAPGEGQLEALEQDLLASLSFLENGNREEVT